MVNPDSDLYRAHPEWALTTDGYEPVLGPPPAGARPRPSRAPTQHVLGQLDALLRDHDIAYVKWDMNRDHVQGSGADGAAGTHAQTLALYRLLDELRARHPGVEIESCSQRRGAHRPRDPAPHRAGVDQRLQRRARTADHPAGRVDAHPARADGRAHRARPARTPPAGCTRSAFRALTALFGHLGVEWNVLDARPTTSASSWPRPSRCTSGSGRCCTAATRCASTRCSTGRPPASHAHGVYAPDRARGAGRPRAAHDRA